MQSVAHPTLNPQVIGQAESALGALLAPVLEETGRTFEQWLILTVLTAAGGAQDRTQLIARIANARKVASAGVEAAIAELTAAGALAAEAGQVKLTAAGQAMHRAVRTRIDEVTAGIFDFTADDLATAGRVLAAITDRVNAFLAGHAGRPSVA
jgi:DNA-binding MarR family transcriptional regulator